MHAFFFLLFYIVYRLWCLHVCTYRPYRLYVCILDICTYRKIHVFHLFPCPLAHARPQQAVSCYSTPTHPAKKLSISCTRTYKYAHMFFYSAHASLGDTPRQRRTLQYTYTFYRYTHPHTRSRALVTISVQLVIRHIRASSSIKSNTFHYLHRFTCYTCYTCHFILYIYIYFFV